MKRLSAWLCTAALLLGSGQANAQKWIATGVADLYGGIEGGGGAASSTGRAQTRMRLGADLAIDESPEDVFGAAVLVAVEPRTAFGIDGRYTRVVRERFAVSGGAAVYLQPGSLAGPLAAFEYRHPLSKAFLLTLGPEVDVFVVGSDLPDRTVIWQALFKVGLRVSF